VTKGIAIATPPRPDLFVPAVASVCLGIAVASLIHGSAMAFVADTDTTEAAGLVAGLLGTLVERPVIHIVLLPCAVFLFYGVLQLFGYRTELFVLERGDPIGLLRRKILEVSGRRSSLHFLEHATRDDNFGDRYSAVVAQSDPRLHRPIEFGTGALTMLGLLGTIIGLTLALQDLPAVMSPNATDDDRSLVLESLGLAFTTTIIGIVGSLILSFFKMILSNLADTAVATASGLENG